MSNPFDQFDAPAAEGGNPFDQFDAPAAKKLPSKGILSDVGGAFVEGAKSAGRAIAGTANIYAGDESALVEKAQAQESAQAQKPAALTAFNQAVTERVKPLGDDPGLLDSVKAIGGAVVDQPKGAGLAVVEQLPNAAPAIAGGMAGMKAGAALGTAIMPGVGTTIGAIGGGLAGMFLGNTAIETGYKGIEAAQDGAVTQDEMSRVKKEGAVKAGVITGVDALTLGLSKAVTNIPARAVESATRNALTKAGVNVADEAAVLAARQSPEISAAVRAAQESAFASANTLGKRAAAGGAALGLETVGEGLGEYLGELAATGKANVADAVLEAMMSLGQSGAEVAWGAARNKKAEQGGMWDTAEAKFQPPPPTLVTEPEPLQQRIDALMGIDTGAMSDKERTQYEKDLTAAFLEPVGVTQDEHGLEIPFTMADYLNAQVRAEDSVRARPLKQNAADQSGNRLQQLADEETQQQPDIPGYVAPEIPVVGALSAAANMAVQSGAHAAHVAQQQAAIQNSQAEASSTKPGKAVTPKTGNLEAAPQLGILAGIAAQAPSIAQSAPNTQPQGQGGMPATAQQVVPAATSPAGVEFDVSKRTNQQLEHLSQHGQPGWKEAAVAEIAKRGAAAPTANSASVPALKASDSAKAPEIPNGDGVTDKPGTAPSGVAPADDGGIKQAPEARKESRGLSVGAMPNTAESVTVKDGVVHIGKYPAQNFDTGEDVTVPAGATDQQIVAALKDAGAISPKHKVFGAEKEAQPAPEDTIGWTRMTTIEREGILKRAGYEGANNRLNLAGVRLAKTPWESMSDAVRAKLEAADTTNIAVANQNPIKNEAPPEEMINEALSLNVLNPGQFTKAALSDKIAEAKKQRKAELENIRAEIESDQNPIKNQSEQALDMAPAVDAKGNDSDSLSQEMAGFTGVSDAEYALRNLSHKDRQDGDIELGNGKFVTIEQAVDAAKTNMDEADWTKPFQFNRVLDIAPVDWNRMVEAMKPQKPTGAELLKARIESDKAKASDTDTRFASNTIFTTDKVAAAKARMKAKLGTMNSGIDPELLIDGMTIAGAYIESGVRKFADYAKAMVSDLGDGVKPYLLSFYEAARAYPGLNKIGMDSQDVAASLHRTMLTQDVLDKAKEVVGESPKVEKKKPANLFEAVRLKADWGVRNIDGYTRSKTGKNQETDYGLKGGVKDEFLADAKRYLKAVSKLLEDQGFETHVDNRGKGIAAVNSNEAGPAVSGDAYLRMNAGDFHVFAQVGVSSVRGIGPAHPQGVSLMVRAGQKNGMNNWLPLDLSAGDLADWFAKRLAIANANPAPTMEAKDTNGVNNADAIQPENLPGTVADRNQGDVGHGNRDSKPLASGVAEDRQGADSDGRVSGRPEGAGSAGNQGQAGQQHEPSVELGKERGDGAERSPADADASGKLDHVIDAEDIGKGGLTKKYSDNIAAIKIIKAMEAEGRAATPEERKQIARYAGWGAIKGVFDPANKQWAKQHEELKSLLTDAEFAAARKSTLNAHYTSPVAVGAMYSALERLGFTGGRVLEPSVGVGNFFGLMPAKLRNASNLHGVELDSLTSRLVAALYPKANIAQSTGFQDFDIPAEFFDAVIGNPPFGSEPIVDMNRSPYSGFSIHNYFLAKSIDKLRPGGIMEVVVSHSFLDSQDERARQWIADRASLIGGVRFPNTAFKENAGTEVVTDILIFQKKTEAERVNGLNNDHAPWVKAVDQQNTNPKTGETATHKVSEFFADNPDLVLGRPSAAGSMYSANEYTVEATGDIKPMLEAWVKTLPENIFTPIDRSSDRNIVDMEIPDGIKPGSFYVDKNGAVMRRGDDVMGNKTAAPFVAKSMAATARMKGMIGLRDLLRQQMRLERSADSSEAEIEANRAKLNTAYDDFLKKFGHLNSVTNRNVFMDDTESQLLQALEFDFDKGISAATAEREEIEPKAPSAKKADIFQRRVMFPPSDFMKVTSAKDALLASLNYRGKVDLDYMGEVYSKSPDETVKELGDVLFDDPQSGLVMADEYLSGDVKTKLAEAKDASLSDAKYRRNVEALEKIIPEDKKPSEISVSIGASFIPSEIYEQFIQHITGGGAKLAYLKSTGQWLIDYVGAPDTTLNSGTFGTSHLSARELFGLSMMGRGAVVKQILRNPDGSTTTIVLENETEAAREKQNAIKNEWQKWLWNDAERADKVASIYNDKMNRIVERKFDGSHLTFPGMNPAISLLEHQKNGVWRGLQSFQVLYDHVVGAGKTFEMATLAMEMRRLGIARKPLFVVQNHLTLQWRNEFTRLYPGSNILAATPEDFSKENRGRMFSKIVTGDWDAVILGHSSLKKIGLPEETEKAVLEEQITEISDAIEETKRNRGDRNIIRDMEGIKSRLEAKMKDKLAAIGKRDKVLTFDELGVDALFIDEMHEFKNLSYNSTMDRNPGMGNPAGSAKAFDLFVKTRWLFDTFGEKTPFITATGTPVSNSLVEMFNMQRYMQYPTLKRENLHVFDAWAKQFGSVENVYEVAPSGSGFRQSTRFAKFTNLPALMSLYNSFADTITLDDLRAQEEAQGKRFPVPKIAGGKPTLVVAQRSPMVAERMGVPRAVLDDAGKVTFAADLDKPVEIAKQETGKWAAKVGDNHLGFFETEEEAKLRIVEKALAPNVAVAPESILGRFANLKQLTKETKGKVNALSLTGEANKAGLDFRLIDPSAPDFAGSKINLAVDNLLRTYHQWSKDKGTQLVFCDMSIPLSARSNFSSKERRLYVRDDAGALVMKRGTLHAADGFESLPFFIVAKGDKAGKRFEVYDAATGFLVGGNFTSRVEAKERSVGLIESETSRQRWLDKRLGFVEITQDLIDEYNNENSVETEGIDAFGPEDIAGISGSAKFSVYDDIKAKLMARGVPEREIAFIHDYSTPVAKAKLFKAVNDGDVRFLLGSTPKMGAGTNVQERLVGLHHIDAPWRPSDLEQREGRIIRRGNKLYERDPEGFEVFIGRYATEQTYDTRRWQILEHKARGIEQLRNFDGTTNEIEDIDGEAANAADMKAAASGDPLILEETKLRNEVKRLERLQDGHADEKVAMERKASSQQKYAEEYGPAELKMIRGLMAEAAKYPADKKGFSPVTISGNKFSDAETATKEIAGTFAAVRSGFPVATVTFRGQRFTFSKPYGETVKVETDIGTMGLWSPNEAFSASGFIQRMINHVDRLAGHEAHILANIEKAKDDVVKLREQAKQPFQQDKDLETARAEHSRVRRALMAKGPSVPDSQRAMVDAAIEAQKDRLRAMGFGQAVDEMFANQGAGNVAERNASLSPADTAVYGMVVDGKSATDILKFIASASRNPMNRQLAKLLLKTGIAPRMTVGTSDGWKFNAGNDKKYAAAYNAKANTVALFRPASAERHVLHELMHAATLKALNQKGLAAIQMKALFAHVKKTGELNGMYGMSDVDEFVAEAFTNPKFQEALKKIAAPSASSSIKSGWHWFVRIVRGILGMPQEQENALSQALDIGIGVMRENMRLNEGSADVRYNAAPGKINQTDTEAFRKWFGDSKVVDANGDPLVVYHGTGATDISEFKVSTSGTYGGGIYLTPEIRGANDYAIYRGAPSSTVYPVYAAIKNPASGSEAAQVASWKGEENAREELIKRGYDGVVDMRSGEIVAFYPEQIKSAIGNNGDFDPNNQDIRYNVADEGWSVAEPSKMDDVIYALQDKQIDMKRVVQSIMKTGKQIKDDFNAYLQEELFHGRAAKGVKDFLDFELRPLLAEMQKAGIDMGDFEEYLWNRHAPERNAQIAKINPDMPDGGSGIETAKARAYLAGLSVEQRKTFEALAAKVEAMNRESQRVLIESGLEKQSTIDAWNNAYQHYVPLQREDVDSGHVGTGKGFSVRGSSSKRAMGSGRQVVDIIANLTMQRERNIVRAEKNRVSNALLGLAVQNPNPDFWKVDQAPKERVVEETAIYTVRDESGKKLDEFTRMDEAERFARQHPGSDIEQTWGDRVKERVTPGFTSRDNVLLTRINGEDHYVIFNERDERAVRMAMSMKNLDVDNMGRVLSVVGKATRYLASVNTQYNPVFGVINLIRDAQGALINLTSTPLAGEQKRVLGYTVDALRGIYADIRAHRKGEKPSSKWAALFEEFQKEGGQTGYRDQYANSEARAEAIKSELEQFKEGKAKQFTRGIFGWLSDYNETMENAVRLAAYKAAKEKGMSNQQAASLAKNITVNFNRKGQMATQVGALYAFFNASVQGTARIAETLFEQRGGELKNVRLSKVGKKIVAGGIMLGSMQAMLLAAAGFDDDEPPEFIRERNLILPIGDGKYLTMAMPLGFHVIPGIGRIATEFVLSGGKDPIKRMASFASMFAESFNPIGSSGFSLQTITPSVVDPFAALAENKDFTGKEIYREDFNKLNPTPGHARAKDVATFYSRWISEALNFMTGGTEFKPGLISWSPDSIDYLIGQAFGGVGREANKVFQTGSAASTGEDLPLYKIPLVGRFVGDTEGQGGQSAKFYEAIKQINMHEAEYKGLLKEGRRQEAAAYLAENPAVKLILAGNHAELTLRKLRSQKRDLVEKDADKEQVRAIDERITATMRKFNERAGVVI